MNTSQSATSPRHIKRRRAQVGDRIEVKGRTYKVDEVCETVGGQVSLYGVVGIESGLPNAFRPGEVSGILRHDAPTPTQDEQDATALGYADAIRHRNQRDRLPERLHAAYDAGHTAGKPVAGY